MILLQVLLLMFHDPEGREIWINPGTVVSLRAKGTAEHYHGHANCLINLDDGKFVAVRETCARVREAVGEHK